MLGQHFDMQSEKSESQNTTRLTQGPLQRVSTFLSVSPETFTVPGLNRRWPGVICISCADVLLRDVLM